MQSAAAFDVTRRTLTLEVLQTLEISVFDRHWFVFSARIWLRNAEYPVYALKTGLTWTNGKFLG